MRRLLCSIMLLIICSPAYGQLTSNVLLRVTRFQSARTGTAFTVDVDGKQYIITARHNLSRREANVDIKLFLDGMWRDFKVRAIYPDNDSVDIVALDVGRKVTVEFPLQPTMADIFIGQQVYFVGYPYIVGSLGTLGGSPDMTSGFTEIPFVKSGILSAIDVRQKNSMVMYVDGHNNIGFSGGPIVYLHRKTGEYRVAAVVQGYKTELSPVLKKEDLQKTDARAYEDLYVRGNSGIVVGYSIKHIVDAIQKDSSERKGNSK